MTPRNFIYVLLALACAAVVWAYASAITGNGEEENDAPIVADAEDAEAVSLGEKIYAGHCAECHGENLEGQPDWQKKNADNTLPAPPHDASGHTWHHPDMANFEYTKSGGSKFDSNSFKSAMPAYGDVLGDQEIIAVLAYIKSTWPEEIQKRHARMNARAIKEMMKM